MFTQLITCPETQTTSIKINPAEVNAQTIKMSEISSEPTNMVHSEYSDDTIVCYYAEQSAMYVDVYDRRTTESQWYVMPLPRSFQ